MRKSTLKEYLERITKDELVKKMRAAGLKHTGLDKTAVVGILDEFLQDEQNIEWIWNGLSPFEKEYLDEFLKYEESPEYKKLESMYQKYGLERSFTRKPWEEKSKLSLLFIDKSVPPQIKKSLESFLTPIVVKYNTLEQPPEDVKNRLNIIGESFAADFGCVINLANSISLALTREKQLPSKSTIVKIDNVLFNKDFVFEYIGGIDGIRSIGDTNRIYGIYMILMETGLLSALKGILNVSEKAAVYLGMKLEDKCRYLLEHYLKSHGIYELSRIVESSYRAELKGNMTECREIIIKNLKNCPIGEWIPIAQFLDYFKMMDKHFLTDQVKYITYLSDKFRVYIEPWVEWKDVEGRFVEVVLQEYLSVLGMVDTVIYEREGGCWDYDSRSFFKVEYFRITPLGAFVLGMNKEYSYEEKAAKAGFTVEDGFQIKLSDELSNQVHKLFFERFASGGNYLGFCIYKISFGAIVKAVDKNITIDSIMEYIRSYSLNGMPTEFVEKMLKWKKDIDKVIIKSITVVQTVNRELVEELQKEPGIKKYITSDLSCAFEIKPDSAAKVKREIEKKEYYCRLI